jgi:hypothetical protein
MTSLSSLVSSLNSCLLMILILYFSEEESLYLVSTANSSKNTRLMKRGLKLKTTEGRTTWAAVRHESSEDVINHSVVTKFDNKAQDKTRNSWLVMQYSWKVFPPSKSDVLFESFLPSWSHHWCQELESIIINWLIIHMCTQCHAFYSRIDFFLPVLEIQESRSMRWMSRWVMRRNRPT